MTNDIIEWLVWHVLPSSMLDLWMLVAAFACGAALVLMAFRVLRRRASS